MHLIFLILGSIALLCSCSSCTPTNEVSKFQKTKTDLIQSSSDPDKLQLITSGGKNNPQRVATSLHFSNGKVIDLRSIDPYRNWSHPILRGDSTGLSRLYDLSDLSADEQSVELSQLSINELAQRDSEYLRVWTETPRIEMSDSIAAVAFNKTYYSNEEDILGTSGQVLLYDHEGEIESQLIDNKEAFYSIKLSKDGRYLVQKYGIDYGEDGGGQLERGFKFYKTNLKSNSLFFEINLGDDQFLQGFDFISNTQFFTFFRRESSRHEKFVIDLQTNIIYKKTMDRELYSSNKDYRGSTFPKFRESFMASDLIEDGFEIIELL